MGYFILGVIAIQFIFPILESITAVILTALEALKGHFGAKVTKYNHLMRGEDKEPTMRSIGFIAPEEVEEEDEYE